MKRKRLALLLAVALTATSVDSTAMVASAADFTADPVVESTRHRNGSDRKSGSSRRSTGDFDGGSIGGYGRY